MEFINLFYGGVDEKGEAFITTKYEGFNAVLRAYEIMFKEHGKDMIQVSDVDDVNYSGKPYFGFQLADIIKSATITERFNADGSKEYCEYAFFGKSGKCYSWEYTYYSNGNKSGKKWDLVYTVK